MSVRVLTTYAFEFWCGVDLPPAASNRLYGEGLKECVGFGSYRDFWVWVGCDVPYFWERGIMR